MSAINMPQSASGPPIEPSDSAEQVPSTPTNASSSLLFHHYSPESLPGSDSASRAARSTMPGPSQGQQVGDGSGLVRGLIHYAHLPTPQSPSVSTLSAGAVPQTPESPLHPGPHGYYASLNRFPVQAPSRKVEDASVLSTPSRHTQIMTPDSSPFGPVTRQTPPQEKTASNSSKLDFTLPTLPATEPNTPLAHTPPPSSPAKQSETPPPPSRSSISPPQLSSPFQVKATAQAPQIAGSARPATGPSAPKPMQVDDVFSATPAPAVISTPPLSPIPGLMPPAQVPSSQPAGGEMERLRQAKLQQRMNIMQDLESRRPDYLVRAKRTMTEADPAALMEDELLRDRERFGGVGITESPHKGRRLTLFQETSEESFEESLMAGGYGRYRTAEWVRQPQPLPPTILQTPGPAGPSKVVAALEEAKSETPPVPLTEKELKKRRRLAAFKGDSEYGPANRLYTVELEGKGRVLLDTPNESITIIEMSAAKKRQTGGSKRKKRVEAASTKESHAVSEEATDLPNWPDSEFPWRLRTEERRDLAKMEEQERLKWIERFLDRDTDEEDDADTGSVGAQDDPDTEVLPSSKWGFIYDDDTERPIPYARGRGKMVPLHANPAQERRRAQPVKKRSAYFPSDPADARAALMSKKNVRALSYRKERRIREEYKDGDTICICRGKDDGRDLVQCDQCRNWFHLNCLGIRSIRDLGPPNVPWYCEDCLDGRQVSPEPEGVEEGYGKEPTFVPTDEAPRHPRSFDGPFFQGPPDSPLPSWGAHKVPKTPTRRREVDADGVARHGPTTPRPPFGLSHSYDDLHFDPTSTPSRGIKVGAPFVTPKNSVSFQTPRQPGRARTFGGPGFLDDSVSSPYMRSHAYEDSPVRRNRSLDIPRPRKLFDTPRPERSPERPGPKSDADKMREL